MHSSTGENIQLEGSVSFGGFEMSQKTEHPDRKYFLSAAVCAGSAASHFLPHEPIVRHFLPWEPLDEIQIALTRPI